MQSEATNQPQLTCQWCAGTIPENAPACASCGAARPREDLVAPGFVQHEEPPSPLKTPEASSQDSLDDEIRAKQILKDLDAYIPEETSVPYVAPRDTSDDVIVVLGVLAISAVAGGLTGWFLAPPLLHEFFTQAVGVDADGPEAFRRLGAFIFALVAMLFGALLATVMRR